MQGAILSNDLLSTRAGPGELIACLPGKPFPRLPFQWGKQPATTCWGPTRPRTPRRRHTASHRGGSSVKVVGTPSHLRSEDRDGRSGATSALRPRSAGNTLPRRHRCERSPTARSFSRTKDGTPAEEGTWALTVWFLKPGCRCLPNPKHIATSH